jgi:predicted ATPase
MIRRICIEHYRSIRDLDLDLGPVTVVTGANGSGKSCLYRALGLLQAGATGRLAEAFAAEGGMPSALYAGPKRRDELHQVRLAVGVETDRMAYRLACGLPTPRITAFRLDPEVKEEDLGIRLPDRVRPVPLAERRNHVLTLRAPDGTRTIASQELDRSESMLSQVQEPHQWPELAVVRAELAAWRFYHQFPCGADSPIRQPRLGVFSPVLAHDGANLAAVVQTIRELEHDQPRLDPLLDRAFPGCRLEIAADERGLMRVAWHQPGIQRPLDARELSDGTLRYLCLAAALLTPRPAPLLVLNEPEASLHPDLIPALGDLIAAAAKTVQVVVTTHAMALAEQVAAAAGVEPVHLRLERGQTVTVASRGLLRR